MDIGIQINDNHEFIKKEANNFRGDSILDRDLRIN